MMYNDHGIMPSEIMQALSNAYKQNEQNSRQNTKVMVESFFATLSKAQVEFLSLSDLPKDVREVVNQINKTLKDWQYNISCIFDVKLETINPTDMSNNIFSALSTFCRCIDILIGLIDTKNSRQLHIYIREGNLLIADLLSTLSKKSIVIRRYL